MAAWTWTSLADKALGAVFNDPMKALENELGLSAKQFPSQAKVVATDATITTLATIKIPVDTTIVLRGFVAARRTGGASGAANDGAGYRVEFVATNTGGTAALIGSGVVTVLGESQVGWDCTLVASGNSILIKVTGAAGNTITWRYTGKTFAVST